jgi:hypothetical protein
VQLAKYWPETKIDGKKAVKRIQTHFSSSTTSVAACLTFFCYNLTLKKHSGNFTISEPFLTCLLDLLLTTQLSCGTPQLFDSPLTLHAHDCSHPLAVGAANLPKVMRYVGLAGVELTSTLDGGK